MPKGNLTAGNEGDHDRLAPSATAAAPLGGGAAAAVVGEEKRAPVGAPVQHMSSEKQVGKGGKRDPARETTLVAPFPFFRCSLYFLSFFLSSQRWPWGGCAVWRG